MAGITGTDLPQKYPATAPRRADAAAGNGTAACASSAWLLFPRAICGKKVSCLPHPLATSRLFSDSPSTLQPRLLCRHTACYAVNIYSPLFILVPWCCGTPGTVAERSRWAGLRRQATTRMRFVWRCLSLAVTYG